MLILVHCLTILIFQLLKHRKRIKNLQSIRKNMEMVQHQANVEKSYKVDLEYKLTFDPPVYRQRYAKVYETLIDERWRKQIKKLCDFGCAEFGLFMFIKQLTSLNDIYFIDIDEDMLRDNLRRIYPLTIEYLKRRQEPLEVNIFAGSVADADYRLSNTDAIVAVELIEHLYPDTLDAFPYNIFGFIEPKIVIVTTPNADFNVLFSSDSKRMRHYDHKFEWTREQFSQWATNVASRFPDYTVSLCGIGRGPDSTEHLGDCSQMALFVRKDVLDDTYISRGSSTPCRCDARSNCKMTAFDCKTNASDCKMNTSDCKMNTSDCKMNMSDCKAYASDCESNASDCKANPPDRQTNASGRRSMCACVCPLCRPDSSFGVCTYYSCSKQVMDYEMQEKGKRDPSYGIYYKFIEKVEYPFERDDRTEEEKMMDEFRYRINTFGYVNGRFFVEERERSEIPLGDLIYGPDSCCISESELSKLLTKHGYKVEACLFQETGQMLDCVIHEPEMSVSSVWESSSSYSDHSPPPSVTDAPPSDWNENLNEWD